LRGVTETQFYSTVYLDSSKPHLFQAGTSSDRLNFFTDLFDLHDVDLVKTYCSRLKNEAAEAEREIQRLTAELGAITLVDTATAQDDYNKLVRIQDKCQSMLRVFTAIKHSTEMWERHEKLRVEMAALEADIGPHTLKSVRAAREAIRVHEKAAAAHASWKRQKKNLLQSVRELQAVVGNLPLQAAQAYIKTMDKVADITKPEKPDADRDAAAVARLKKMLGVVPEAKHLPTLTKKEAQLGGRISEIQETLDALEEHGSEDHGACPLCQSKLRSDHFTTMRESLTRDQGKAKKQRATARELRTALEAELEWREYDVALATFTKRTSNYDEAKHKALRKYVSVLQSYKRLETEEPDVPAAAEHEPDEVLEALLEKLTKLKTLREQPGLPDDCERDLRTFQEANGLPWSMPVLRTFAADKMEVRQEQLRSVNEKIPSLRSAIDMAAADAGRARKLRIELKAKKLEAADLPVLRMLVDAYSKTGIKSLIVKRIAKTIEKNLNRLSPQVMLEPMKFELLVEGANFHVIANRKNKGKPMISDVRSLSGAERRMFILLFVAATLPLMPASKRFDSLILDEPFANLDDPNIERLRDRLIPMLSKVVPKLVLMVTSPSMVPQGARVVTAVKANNESRLEG
jgi:DNA repair exonuclease SbcCD ATPase subunit